MTNSQSTPSKTPKKAPQPLKLDPSLTNVKSSAPDTPSRGTNSGKDSPMHIGANTARNLSSTHAPVAKPLFPSSLVKNSDSPVESNAISGEENRSEPHSGGISSDSQPVPQSETKESKEHPSPLREISSQETTRSVENAVTSTEPDSQTGRSANSESPLTEITSSFKECLPIVNSTLYDIPKSVYDFFLEVLNTRWITCMQSKPERAIFLGDLRLFISGMKSKIQVNGWTEQLQEQLNEFDASIRNWNSSQKFTKNSCMEASRIFCNLMAKLVRMEHELVQNKSSGNAYGLLKEENEKLRKELLHHKFYSLFYSISNPEHFKLFKEETFSDSEVGLKSLKQGVEHLHLCDSYKREERKDMLTFLSFNMQNLSRSKIRRITQDDKAKHFLQQLFSRFHVISLQEVHKDGKDPSVLKDLCEIVSSENASFLYTDVRIGKWDHGQAFIYNASQVEVKSVSKQDEELVKNCKLFHPAMQMLFRRVSFDRWVHCINVHVSPDREKVESTLPLSAAERRRQKTVQLLNAVNSRSSEHLRLLMGDFNFELGSLQTMQTSVEGCSFKLLNGWKQKTTPSEKVYSGFLVETKVKDDGIICHPFQFREPETCKPEKRLFKTSSGLSNHYPVYCIVDMSKASVSSS